MVGVNMNIEILLPHFLNKKPFFYNPLKLCIRGYWAGDVLKNDSQFSPSSSIFKGSKSIISYGGE